MPLYEYRCEAGHKYELRQPFNSPAEQPCEKCGKPARRVLHARPVMFKGSGFYSTDSRGSSTRRSSTSATNGSSSNESKGESKGESKSDAKSDGGSDNKGSSKRSESRSEAHDSISKKVDSTTD